MNETDGTITRAQICSIRTSLQDELYAACYKRYGYDESRPPKYTEFWRHGPATDAEAVEAAMHSRGRDWQDEMLSYVLEITDKIISRYPDWKGIEEV